MSQQVRQYIDIILKASLVILGAVLSYMGQRLISDVDLTHDSAIRTEGNVRSLENSINEMEKRFDTKFYYIERDIEKLQKETQGK